MTFTNMFLAVVLGIVACIFLYNFGKLLLHGLLLCVLLLRRTLVRRRHRRQRLQVSPGGVLYRKTPHD